MVPEKTLFINQPFIEKKLQKTKKTIVCTHLCLTGYFFQSTKDPWSLVILYKYNVSQALLTNKAGQGACLESQARHEILVMNPPVRSSLRSFDNFPDPASIRKQVIIPRSFPVQIKEPPLSSQAKDMI